MNFEIGQRIVDVARKRAVADVHFRSAGAALRDHRRNPCDVRERYRVGIQLEREPSWPAHGPGYRAARGCARRREPQFRKAQREGIGPPAQRAVRRTQRDGWERALHRETVHERSSAGGVRMHHARAAEDHRQPREVTTHRRQGRQRIRHHDEHASVLDFGAVERHRQRGTRSDSRLWCRAEDARDVPCGVATLDQEVWANEKQSRNANATGDEAGHGRLRFDTRDGRHDRAAIVGEDDRVCRELSVESHVEVSRGKVSVRCEGLGDFPHHELSHALASPVRIQHEDAGDERNDCHPEQDGHGGEHHTSPAVQKAFPMLKWKASREKPLRLAGVYVAGQRSDPRCPAASVKGSVLLGLTQIARPTLPVVASAA